jgi:hypothetical protein
MTTALNFDHLIGKKVDIIKENIQRKRFDGSLYEHEQLSINEEKIKKDLNLSFPNIRFIIPGYCYTQEFKSNRLNIDIDENGIIQKISFY